MTRSLPFALLAGASLLSATAGVAATATTPARPAARTTTAMHMVTTKRTTTTAPAGKGRMVSAKLANGKTVTYNCSLAGNATKQACK